ncbi:MAG: hypothetical protein FWC22_02080 [Treponema sp.]|nr:hypothetical protein [Treponema sp.]
MPVSRIADDSLLRINMNDSWIIDTPGRVLARSPVIETLANGERVQISTMEGREEFRVIFARELMRGSTAADRRMTGSFPGWAQGSWMLTRRKDSGEGVEIRIYLRSDQNTHIQFRPYDAEKCQMDVIVYGGHIARSIPVAVPFQRLYTMQLNEILRLVEQKFPVRYFEPDITKYKYHWNFISSVRSSLGNLRFADDGAIDENGNYVLIETLQNQNPRAAGLNCSGFAKWLVDGILRPVTGERLTIPPLKTQFGERGSSFTELWEERFDLFFGLDWIRNLASIANGTLRSPAYSALEEFEIRRDHFSLISVNQNNTFVTQTYPGFMSEAGYGIEGLHPLLYTLAIDEPYQFYLAAVSRERANPSSPRGTPRLREYFHVAALVPYFDENGVFRIVVFESAEETSFSAFRSRYRTIGHFVNLVSIPVTARFDP